MDYQDSRAASAEFLRLTLPLMARHDAALHPITYAVWYEYVSGRNGALRGDVDAVLAAGRSVSEELVRLLFRKYIADVDPRSVEEAGERLREMLAVMSGRAQKSYEDAQAYDASLQGFSQALKKEEYPVALREQIDQMLRHTQDIRTSMTDLREGIASSRAEIEMLRQELKAAREEAMRDALTGLGNRRAFDCALKDMVAQAAESGDPLCLLIFDIDHFKRVNDQHGHVLGDRVLCAVADALKANVKGKDFAARHGGEEFAALLPATPLGGGQTVAEAVRKAVGRGRIRRQDSDVLVGQVTVSAGVAAWRAGESPEELFRRADEALYASKRDGRNKVTVVW